MAVRITKRDNQTLILLEYTRGLWNILARKFQSKYDQASSSALSKRNVSHICNCTSQFKLNFKSNSEFQLPNSHTWLPFQTTQLNYNTETEKHAVTRMQLAKSRLGTLQEKNDLISSSNKLQGKESAQDIAGEKDL